MKGITEKEITAGNKLIAEFMNENIDIDKFFTDNIKTERPQNWISIVKSQIDSDIPKYHLDWNWLMPVVAKIHTIQSLGIAMHYKLDEQYSVVISFIKSLNTYTNKKHIL